MMVTTAAPPSVMRIFFEVKVRIGAPYTDKLLVDMSSQRESAGFGGPGSGRLAARAAKLWPKLRIWQKTHFLSAYWPRA